MQPLFLQEPMAAFEDQIILSIEGMLRRWKDGARLGIAAEVSGVAHEVIGRILFSADFTGEAAELGETIQVRRRYIEYWYGSLIPRPELVPNRINRDYRRAMRTFDAAVYQMIRARRKKTAPRVDLLTLLLQARNKDGTGNGRPAGSGRGNDAFDCGGGDDRRGSDLDCYLLAHHQEVARTSRGGGPWGGVETECRKSKISPGFGIAKWCC